MSNKCCNEVSILNLPFGEFPGDGQYDRPSIAAARHLAASVFSGAQQKRKRGLPSFQLKVCRYNYFVYCPLLKSIIVIRLSAII